MREKEEIIKEYTDTAPHARDTARIAKLLWLLLEVHCDIRDQLVKTNNRLAKIDYKLYKIRIGDDSCED